MADSLRESILSDANSGGSVPASKIIIPNPVTGQLQTLEDAIGNPAEPSFNSPHITGTATFDNRPIFEGGATPWDSVNLDPSNFLDASTLQAALATALAPYDTMTSRADAVAAATAPLLLSAFAMDTFMPFSGGAFTGPVTGVTAASKDSSLLLATTAFVTAAIGAAGGGTDPNSVAAAIAAALVPYITSAQIANTYMPLSGGTFLGTVSGVTALTDDISAKLATTAFVATAIGNAATTPGGNVAQAIAAALIPYLKTADAETEFAQLAGADFTGKITCPTPLTTDDGNTVATTSYVFAHDALIIGNVVGQANAAISAALVPYLTQNAASTTYLPLAGGALTGQLTLRAPAGTWTPISFNTNGSQRWQIGKNNEGESGGNTGSNFDFFCYADNGAIIANAIHIARATGVMSLSSRPVFNGATPWDSANQVSPATAASVTAALGPYLTAATAAATYTTPAEVNAALATFLTQSDASNIYLRQTDAATTYAPLSALALKADLVAPTFTGNVTFTGIPTVSGPSTALRSVQFNTNATIRWTIGADNELESGSNSGSNFTIFGYNDAGTVSSSPLSISRATGVANFGVRPTFNRFVPWDSSNLPSPFQTTGGTITGATQFNAIPVINATVPVVTDSSLSAATASWVQSVITSRVGTNGPFIPTSGHGMPYDINFTMQGLPVPGPTGLPFVLLQYVFVRAVTIPAAFAGSKFLCRSSATAACALNVGRTGSVAGQIATINFAIGATNATIGNSAGPFSFVPGDVLTITTATNDPTLGGISGTILGSIT